MKILIPSMGFGYGGGARVLSQLANYWIKQGHQVSFLTPVGGNNPYFPTNATIITFNKFGKIFKNTTKKEIKNNHKLNLNKQINIKSKIFSLIPFGFLVGQWRLYKAINNLTDNFDIIMANHSTTAFPVAYSKPNSKKFFYIQAYEPEFYDINQNLISKIASWYIAKTYKIKKLIKIVNSPIYYQYKNLQADKFVPCGLDLNLYFAKNSQQFNFDKTIIKLGAIGRIEPHKGTSYVLESFKKLINKTTGKQFELYLAFGDLNSINHDNIKIVKPNDDAELAAFYREMDIVIAPGTIQFGAVHYPVIESMACMTPIITTFYLPAHDANSWLVAPNSSDAIVEQILNILTQPDLALEKAQNALRDIQQFDWNIVSVKMLNLFQNSLC